MIGTLEAVDCRQTRELAFTDGATALRKWDPIRQHRTCGDSISVRAVQARLRRLAFSGLVNQRTLAVPGRGTYAYHLTDRGRDLFPSVCEATHPRVTKPDEISALRGWLRAELWIAVRALRWNCDQSVEAREVLANVTGNRIARTGPLPYDIVYRNGRAGIALVDDQREGVTRLINKLPIHRDGGPKVQVFVFPCADGSTWDADVHNWRPGLRLGQILLVLKDAPQYSGWSPELAHPLAQRFKKKRPAWESLERQDAHV